MLWPTPFLRTKPTATNAKMQEIHTTTETPVSANVPSNVTARPTIPSKSGETTPLVAADVLPWVSVPLDITGTVNLAPVSASLSAVLWEWSRIKSPVNV